MKIHRLLLLLAVFATGAFAQAPAASPVVSTDPAKLALAREVISIMKADKMFDSMVAQMKQSASQITSVSPDAGPEQRAKASALQEKIMDLSMAAAKNLVSRMDEVYADVYTIAELNAMKAFFSSAEGQSMLAKQPQIMQHVMPMVQDMQRTLIPQVQKLVDESKGPALPPAADTPATK